MFTGIIENTGVVKKIKSENKNKDFWIECDFTSELKIDQSLAHNGVCLTVVEISDKNYRVTAIDETLQRTNLNQLNEGDWVNLERCVKVNDRLDGHIVQGHVDQIAKFISKEDSEGSYVLGFEYDESSSGNVTISKG